MKRRDLEKRLAETPGDRALAARVGGLCVELDRGKRALEVLKPLHDHLADLDEKLRGQVALDYGIALAMDMQWEKSATVLGEAVPKLPDHARINEARLAYGVALVNLGRRTEAREQWQKAAEADPKGRCGERAREFLKRISAEPGGKG